MQIILAYLKIILTSAEELPLFTSAISKLPMLLESSKNPIFYVNISHYIKKY
jgi:hypothetical protein